MDRLELAGEAAEILDRVGVAAYGKRADGRVTLDGWATQQGRRVAFSLEVDEDTSAEELAARCLAHIRASLA